MLADKHEMPTEKHEMLKDEHGMLNAEHEMLNEQAVQRQWTDSGQWTGSEPAVNRQWTGSEQALNRQWTGSEAADSEQAQLRGSRSCIKAVLYWTVLEINMQEFGSAPGMMPEGYTNPLNCRA
jgi:hypothetical protein